ncbi:conserved protein of unknown function [Tenacibaculum sp. 190130A14a]|uniref:Protein SirB1 N-terminal domain-containing protein n=1 Tax=Tenacibaculum polynesiense TaxID=3137857 RepID=A0ABP1F714_9FLAO
MNRFLAISFLVTVFLPKIAVGQDHLHEDAFLKIVSMHDAKEKYSFKEAVFAVENAYMEGELDTLYLNMEIQGLTKLIENIVKSRKLLNYNHKDKEAVLKYASLYSVMKDTIPIYMKGGQYEYQPYGYDFEDIWGEKDWRKMFVSKLLIENKGNCHSLPYLYKILAEEIGVKAHLALAPNHIYIKHRNEKDGWYNTELTSGYFPIDAWIMASGYVHLDGIRNGLYMKALNDKESLALLLVDLAQGYHRKYPDNNGAFILRCLEKALQYYPNYINALLLKLETEKRQLQAYVKSKHKTINEIIDDPKGKIAWVNLNTQVRNIHELGYRQMPKRMYLDWLVSLKEEKEKYLNKKIMTLKK